MTRTFLVGAPRSGTTLLQSLLVATASMVSFPESHIARKSLFPHRYVRRYGIAHPATRGVILAYLGEIEDVQAIDLTEQKSKVPRLRLRQVDWVRVLARTFDVIAQREGQRAWLEKTPDHIRFLDLLERAVPGARFIHLVRNGPDVVASLVEVSRRFPEAWGGERSVDWCVGVWNRNLAITAAALTSADHIGVAYERLVEDPEGTVRAVSDFLELEFDRGALAGYSVVAERLRTEREPWKAGVSAEIRKARSKFTEVLSSEEQTRALATLSRYDPSQIHLVRGER